jgi:hypothetical protein
LSLPSFLFLLLFTRSFFYCWANCLFTNLSVQ